MEEREPRKPHCLEKGDHMITTERVATYDAMSRNMHHPSYRNDFTKHYDDLFRLNLSVHDLNYPAPPPEIRTRKIKKLDPLTGTMSTTMMSSKYMVGKNSIFVCPSMMMALLKEMTIVSFIMLKRLPSSFSTGNVESKIRNARESVQFEPFSGSFFLRLLRDVPESQKNFKKLLHSTEIPFIILNDAIMR